MPDTLERMSRPKKPPTENVRIEADIAKKARTVAAWLDVSLPDYLSGKLRGEGGTVEDDFEEMIRAASKDGPTRKKKTSDT